MADTANGNGGEIPEIELIIKVSIAEAPQNEKKCVSCNTLSVKLSKQLCVFPTNFYFLSTSGRIAYAHHIIFQ